MHADAPSAADLQIHITRTFAAPVTTVFNAWTTPAILKQWFASPTAEHFMVEDSFDVRVGGHYRFGVLCPDGHTFYETGRFQEIIPSERLLIMADWERIEMEPLPLFVEFHEHPDGTEITLVQSGFPSPQMCASVAWAWDGCLNQLTAILARPAAERDVV